ncbi:oocyte zinc finger protein XlCOF7.1-like [Bufo bufo]|uniref:oocyte zinc finger protein XlCOF7.1-like n=1 Tax=Bufo bufo TaxID=8384 RepID=UPI001ABDC36D|nr:oocyte zinc finger protein XlCOF7.1-like [Bufo bufo]
METDEDKMSEKILNLTLEIICLLTGEDYTVVKRTSGNVIPSNCSSGEWGGIQRPILKATPHSLIHEKRNKQKVLELTSKIIELLTGEVPVRCQDVTVHFSMEEWEYLEGHKDLYKDIMMEDQQNLISPVGFGSKDQIQEVDTSALTLSYLKDEDGEINGNVQGIAKDSNSYSVEEVEITTITQYPSVNIEEKTPCDGRNLLKSNNPVECTMCRSPHFLEEQGSRNEEKFANRNTYTLMDQTPQYTSTDIKVEEATLDEDLTDPNSYTVTDHGQYILTHIKNEPVSSSEVNLDLGIHATMDGTQQNGYTQNKVDIYDGEKLTNPDCTTSAEHTKQYPTKEESVLKTVLPLQKQEFSSSRKPVEKRNKKTEQNYNDISVNNKKYFCTIKQTSHSLEILYNCPECPECFTSNLDLAKHQIIHTGGMVFICSVCGRCFKKKSDLVIHQVTHGESWDFYR